MRVLEQVARADFEKSAPLGRALGSNVHLRMEFSFGLCDNQPSFWYKARLPLPSHRFARTATCRKACMYAQKAT